MKTIFALLVLLTTLALAASQSKRLTGPLPLGPLWIPSRQNTKKRSRKT